jgi:hypothetical protein
LLNLQFAANTSGASSDFGYPVYTMASGSKAIAVKVHCTEPWGICAPEGHKLYVESGERPEDGGAAGKDSHFAIVDSGSGNEYDFWNTQWPPANGVLTVGWGGLCSLSGTGYNNCGATASGTALSIGIIRAKDLVAAVQKNGALPYALQVGVKCTNGFVAPFTTSDGSAAGCPPEGARAYLAMHDADVNATSSSGIVKALLRTIDEDHFGMFITDQNGGQDGFSLVTENDVSYTAFGMPGPFVSQVIPLAISEGMNGTSPFENVYYMPLTASGIDFASKLKFL